MQLTVSCHGQTRHRPTRPGRAALRRADRRRGPTLFSAEKAEFEAVLGTSVEIVADANRHHQRWIIRDRGDSEETPTLVWDPARRELTSFANSAAEFASTLNLLHTLAWGQQTRATDTPLADSVLAVDRIYTEVANTYPGFALRGLDWDQITQRHARLPEMHGEEFLLGVQRWIAELDDAHTSARRPTRRFHPPYRARMTCRQPGTMADHLRGHTPAARTGRRPQLYGHDRTPARIHRLRPLR